MCGVGIYGYCGLIGGAIGAFIPLYLLLYIHNFPFNFPFNFHRKFWFFYTGDTSGANKARTLKRSWHLLVR
jgi:hypothetical protein